MVESLSQFVLPDETVLELYPRTFIEPLDSGVFFLGLVRAAQIVEIVGPGGCGKTTTLLQVVANAILPATAGGRVTPENVVLIDLDNKFDILRLMAMLNARIHAATEAAERSADPEVLDRTMQECLERFHLIRCGDSRELLGVLKTLRPLVMKLQESGRMRLLLIDDISAFYWLDSAVKPRTSTHGRQQSSAPSALTLQAVHAACITELEAMAKQLKLAILVTKHAFRGEGGLQGSGELDWQHKEVMSRTWADAISRRVLLQHIGGGVGSLPSKFAAKWETPMQPQPQPFLITDAGVVQSSSMALSEYL